MRFARILAGLGAAVVAAAAPAAKATPIAVAFEGSFSHHSGSPASIPFAGTFFYDSDTPNTSVSPPFVLFAFAPGAAGMRIETAEAVYASGPASPDVFAHSIPVWLDANGDIVPNENDPDAVVHGALFYWTSFGSNVPSSVQTIQIEMVAFVVEPPLPDSAGALAEQLLGAAVSIYGEGGFALGGTIASAVPVPEPSSAGLLLLGLALLALRGAARRTPARAVARRAGLSALTLLSIAPTAQATSQLVATRAEWEAAVGTFETEDFESTAHGQGGCTAWVPGYEYNSCAHEIRIESEKLDIVFGDGSHPQAYVFDSGFVNGSREIRGDLHNVSLVSFGPRYNRIELAFPVTAFAVDLADFHDGSSEFPASLWILTESFLLPSGTAFIGVISDEPFREVTFLAEDVGNMWYYLDDVSFAPVPEPSPALLLAGGLVALALRRRGAAGDRTGRVAGVEGSG